MTRSYLFAPGHVARLLDRAFTAGADAVMLDLDEAVPPEAKPEARRTIAARLAAGPTPVPAWVGVSTARTDACAADLEAVAADAYGLRLPRVESPEDVRWVSARAPGLPIMCAIESARGLLAAVEIAAVPGVRHLAPGGAALQAEQGTDEGVATTRYARSHLAVVSRAHGLAPPIDGAHLRLNDDTGLHAQSVVAKVSGFRGKSAIHPSQLPTIHAVFEPTGHDLARVRGVLVDDA